MGPNICYVYRMCTKTCFTDRLPLGYPFVYILQYLVPSSPLDFATHPTRKASHRARFPSSGLQDVDDSRERGCRPTHYDNTEADDSLCHHTCCINHCAGFNSLQRSTEFQVYVFRRNQLVFKSVQSFKNLQLNENFGANRQN